MMVLLSVGLVLLMAGVLLSQSVLVQHYLSCRISAVR